VLDIACGTGAYSIALAVKGHHVWGLDLDEKMIAAARRKAAGRDVTFAVGNMLDVDSIFPGRVFDLVFCIGNSLVHLGDRDSVSGLVKKVLGLLDRGGMFIAQVVNYDRIVRSRRACAPAQQIEIESLPVIERAEHGITFIRNYEFTGDPEHINFNTEIRYGNVSIPNSVKLLALQSGDLVGIVRSAGFSDVRLFGGYDESRHDENAMATVIKASK